MLAKKVQQLRPTAREIANQIADEVFESNGDRDEVVARLCKLFADSRYHYLHSELAELLFDSLGRRLPQKAAKLPRGTAEEILRRAAQRAARVQEAARFVVRLGADMTEHDAWVKGGLLRHKYGRRNSQRKIFEIPGNKQKLEKDGFCQA